MESETLIQPKSAPEWEFYNSHHKFQKLGLDLNSRISSSGWRT